MIHIKEALDGRFYFVIKANNHEPVSTSQMYPDRSGAKEGAAALLKATGEFWALAFATLIEERAQGSGEDGWEFTIPDAVKLLMDLRNEDLQKIIDRMPYKQK